LPHKFIQTKILFFSNLKEELIPRMNSLTLQRVIVVAMAFWTRVNAKSSKAAKSSKNQKEPCHLSFDIHGNPEAFKPYKYIEVSDQGCDYTATIKFDLVNAGMPMPTNPSEDCDLASTACNGMSCLHEVRNLYMLGNDFENFTVSPACII
jgi:hypothetical protein